MGAVSEGRPTIEVLFRAEFARLTRSLAVAEGDDEAAGAVLEAFVEAGRRWARVASLDDPAGWVRRVAMSRLQNGGRHRRRRAEGLAVVQPRGFAESGAPEPDLLGAVRALPVQQRRCVCLHHIGDYPVAEVASALGIAPSAVETHLHHGRAALRRAVRWPDGGGDPVDRLNGLTPNVDEDAALAWLGRARTRRVVRSGVSAAVVAALVVAAAVVSWRHADHRQNVAAGPTTTAIRGLLSASTVRDGIELTVTLPAGQVDVGQRVRAEVVVRNVGAVPVHWVHGGCAVPASAVLTTAGAPVVDRRAPMQWDGTTPLAGWLGPHNALAPSALVDPKAAGSRLQLCTLNLVVETIAPGGETRWSGTTDDRVPPGPLAPQELAATFVGYNQPADYPGMPRPPVEVRVAVPVRDDPARASSADAAGAAFAADHRLQPFLDLTRHELDANPVAVTQTWATEVSWWRRAWELWVTPYYNSNRALRLRYDPRVGAVVDARLVSPYQPPGDDPDHKSAPGPPDTSLP